MIDTIYDAINRYDRKLYEKVCNIRNTSVQSFRNRLWPDVGEHKKTFIMVDSDEKTVGGPAKLPKLLAKYVDTSEVRPETWGQIVDHIAAQAWPSGTIAVEDDVIGMYNESSSCDLCGGSGEYEDDQDEMQECYECEEDNLSSCMSGSAHTHLLELYKNERIQAVCMRNDDGKLIGRALLWRMTDGRRFMDRVYPNHGGCNIAIRKHAAEQGWLIRPTDSPPKRGEDIHHLAIVVDACGKWPYMDTFRYMHKVADGSCCVLYSWPSPDAEWRLCSCSGGFESAWHECYGCGGSLLVGSGHYLGNGKTLCDECKHSYVRCLVTGTLMHEDKVSYVTLNGNPGKPVCTNELPSLQRCSHCEGYITSGALCYCDSAIASRRANRNSLGTSTFVGVESLSYDKMSEWFTNLISASTSTGDIT